ncbi:transposase [Phormidium sp. FACHB-1136]|nr:transposase [Phormidium sp. FACHB-1136]
MHVARPAERLSGLANGLHRLSNLGERWHLGCVHDRLRAWVRVSEGRPESPSEVILDRRSVAAAPMVHRAVGVDAAKKMKGRKHHGVVDTLGLMMAVVITAASVTEREGGKQVLQKLHQMGAAMARIDLVWVDGGYSGFKFIQ